MKNIPWGEYTLAFSAMAGGIALAAWSFFQDTLRKELGHPDSSGGQPEPAPSDPTHPCCGSRWTRSPGPALILLGGGLVLHYSLTGHHPRLALLGYLPLWTGIGFLAAYAIRRGDSHDALAGRGNVEEGKGASSSLRRKT